jgi:hypothetical protein
MDGAGDSPAGPYGAVMSLGASHAGIFEESLMGLAHQSTHLSHIGRDLKLVITYGKVHCLRHMVAIKKIV